MCFIGLGGKPALGNEKDPTDNTGNMKLNQISLRGMDHLLQNRPDIAYLGNNLIMADEDIMVKYAFAVVNILPKLYNLIVGHYRKQIDIRNICNNTFRIRY